jgi:EAL domain-containing protein (putative c-di-GMP-specific phosphodiesterase class I)
MQLDFMRGEGCDEAQGYLISKPLPAEQLESLLATDRSLTQAAELDRPAAAAYS